MRNQNGKTCSECMKFLPYDHFKLVTFSSGRKNWSSRCKRCQRDNQIARKQSHVNKLLKPFNH